MHPTIADERAPLEQAVKRVDFIVPCYNEATNVRAFHEQFSDAFNDRAYDWRLIMVDDGSRDKTLDCLKEIAADDARVHVIGFSRNFGKEAAIYAGLERAGGDYVGIIDADLQQQPSVAREMLDALAADDNIDCVAAYQEERREGALMGAFKHRFYSVFARASRTETVANASDFRIFRKRVAEAVLSLPEYYRFSKGIFSWIGFETLPWPYIPDDRKAGESKWSFKSLLGYALEGLISFTMEPLHVITKLGMASSFIAVVYALVVIIQTLAFGVDLPGYASTICLILLFGGAQLFAIGIIGEYLGRAYIQGKNRPIYLVREEIASSVEPSE